MEEVLTCKNCSNQTWYIKYDGFECKSCKEKVIITGIKFDITKLNKD